MSKNSGGSVRAGLHGYVLDGDVILFDEPRHRLFSLNATASFIWLASAAGLSRERIVQRLSDETGALPERVAADVDELLAGWRDATLAAVPAAAEVDGSRPDLGRAAAVPRLRNAAGADSAARTPGFIRAIRLVDAGIRVVGDAALASCVDAVLGHLTVAPGEANDWPELELSKHAEQYALRFDGRLLDRCRHRESVVPMLHGNVEILMYRASSCLAALHAAAVVRNGAGILLPAVSGRGKSTLTAALVARGYDYCTDDLALLTGEPIRLRSVPLRLGLKSGSWPVLEKLIPELAALPAHRRADARLVKYLPYDSVLNGPAQRRAVAVAAMVFPSYTPGAGAVLRAVTRSDAFVRMAEAGYDLPGQLDEPTVRKLVGWIGGLACYELLFDDLEAAVAQLDGVPL